MDGGGEFTKGTQGAEDNYVTIKGDVWYTVTMEFTNVEGKLKVTGKVVNKATGVEVATTNLQTQVNYVIDGQEAHQCTYLNGCVYHGRQVTGRSLAYVDNITASTHPKAAQ